MDYKIKEYGNEIYEIEDFISDDVSNSLLSLVDLDGDSGWLETHPGNIVSDLQGPKFIKFIEHMLPIKIKIVKLFQDFTSCSDITNIRRLCVGQFMKEHDDLGPEKELPIRYGIAIYLNDGFEGGELYYKDFDIKITPKKNSIVIHKSTNTHAVLPVKSGKRYSITAFIEGDESTRFRY